MEKDLLVHISLVALLDDEGRILLERRKSGLWGLLGGHTKPIDKGRVEAAFRELFEESPLRNITNVKHSFLHDEIRDGCQFFIDVFTANYYGEQMPVPLVGEKMLDERWFSLKNAQKLNLTEIASKVINEMCHRKRDLVEECRQHFQAVVNIAKAKGGRSEEMTALQQELISAEEILSGIKKQKGRSKNRGVVLIVDDEKDLLQTFKEAIESEGFRVLSFSDPLNALTWTCASDVDIDAVIVDYWMPRMNGETLISELRSCISPDTKVILLSAVEKEELRAHGIRFFKKPVMPDELIRAIT